VYNHNTFENQRYILDSNEPIYDFELETKTLFRNTRNSGERMRGEKQNGKKKGKSNHVSIGQSSVKGKEMDEDG